MDCVNYQALKGVWVKSGRKVEERTPLGAQGIFSIPSKGFKLSIKIVKLFLPIHTLHQYTKDDNNCLDRLYSGNGKLRGSVSNDRE